MGDHATNISEQLIYAVRGKDVRHTEVSESDIQVLQTVKGVTALFEGFRLLLTPGLKRFVLVR